MADVPDVLLRIKEKKQGEVAALYRTGKAAAYESQALEGIPSVVDFAEAISGPGYCSRLIAEFKKKSPSKGQIRPGAEPEEIAELYERCGASAMSVLTDSHFDGELDYLSRVGEVVDLPLLRKDFIIDPAQIYEARVYGADAILLIAALLEPSQIRDYIDIAASLGMDCLVESHNEAEIEKAVEGGAAIFGINNRNLHDFSVERGTTLRLLKYVPEGKPIVTESGIMSYEHVKQFWRPRINAMLVGESIMSAKLNPTLSDMEKKVHELLGHLETVIL
ncbi:MAG: indole-3-glycerol phosphate synthase TrpC [Planctomycetota bacterium]|jgi:indole-3-glycerol phosphate synthase